MISWGIVYMSAWLANTKTIWQKYSIWINIQYRPTRLTVAVLINHLARMNGFIFQFDTFPSSVLVCTFSLLAPCQFESVPFLTQIPFFLLSFILSCKLVSSLRESLLFTVMLLDFYILSRSSLPTFTTLHISSLSSIRAHQFCVLSLPGSWSGEIQQPWPDQPLTFQL